jgi:hypothetical protein
VKAPKGFAKNYFTLSAIQAYSTCVSIEQDYIHNHFFTLQTDGDYDEEPTEDDLETLAANEQICTSAHRKYCSCRHSTVAHSLIRQNPKQKLLISPYVFTNSTISPPFRTFFSNQKNKGRHL